MLAYEIKPEAPAQPNEAHYGLDKLCLFQTQSRETFRQLYGVEPEPWTKAKRTKRWADTSVLEKSSDPENDVAAYDYFDTAEKKWKSFTLTVKEASEFNLPGAAIYPKYVVQPTLAVVTDGMNTSIPVNPATLCYRQEAEAVMKEIGGTDLQEAQITGAPFAVVWGTELRRPWVFNWRGSTLTAPGLLVSKYAMGVGAAGHWDLSASSPAWVAEQQETGEKDTRPEVPVPMRHLLANERLETGMFGMTVARTDLTLNEPGPGTGALTVAQDQRLSSIEAAVNAIRQKLGI
jgi:hypothetical protein